MHRKDVKILVKSKNNFKNNLIINNKLEFQGVPWSSSEFHGVPWSSTEFLGVPWSSTEFHGGVILGQRNFQTKIGDDKNFFVKNATYFVCLHGSDTKVA